jgi:hypothetical protein
VKAHRSAAGAKGGSGRKRLDAREGVAPRKIHCLADDRGRPVAFALTTGIGGAEQRRYRGKRDIDGPDQRRD